MATDLRRPGVAALAGIMLLPGLASFSIAVHLVPYLTGIGHPATTAAAALGATIGVSAIGKLTGGMVADRIGTLPTLRLALVLWAVSVAVLHHASTLPPLGLFVLLYGIALGANVAVIPALAITIVGGERFGTLFGLLQLATMLASASGPIASGIIFDRTGRYDGAVFLWLAAMAIAALISWRMQQPVAHAMRAAA